MNKEIINQDCANDAAGFRRRKLIKIGSALTAAFMLIGFSADAQESKNTSLTKDINIQNVEFKNVSIKMAGNLYLPAGFHEDKKYAAIVVVHPGGGVKEPGF